MKNPKKTQLNQRTFYNLQSHMAYLHTNNCVLIRHTFYESLVKIQHFGNVKKCKGWSITCSHICHIYVLIRCTICERLVKKQHKYLKDKTLILHIIKRVKTCFQKNWLFLNKENSEWSCYKYLAIRVWEFTLYLIHFYKKIWL